jgi:hypothetical protein
MSFLSVSFVGARDNRREDHFELFYIFFYILLVFSTPLPPGHCISYLPVD